MRGWRSGRLVMLALAAIQAAAPAWAQHDKRHGQPAFAEPADIIAAEGNFTHLGASKGIAAALRATAAADAQIFAPQLIRVSQFAATAAAAQLAAPWHTRQLWMSCDGSVGVTHGEWLRGPATGWYVTIWRRQKDASYKWVLAQGGALKAPAPGSSNADSDMVAASVADCPAHRAAARKGEADHRPAAVADYLSGHSDDGTLAWATTMAADGSRSFALQLKQDGDMREVLRAAAAPPGTMPPAG